MIGLKNRGSLPAITEDEFEHLVAQFRGLFLAEHNEDGTHITRDREFDFVPVGAEMAWGSDTPPRAWVILDGSQKNRLTYQGLFNHYGTTYGVGDGSTTFNLPDLRGRFILGKSASGTGSVLGSTGGLIDHTHTLGSHTHSISTQAAHTHTGPSHTHTGPSHTHTMGAPDNETSVDWNLDGVQADVAAGNHLHTIAASGTGNTGAGGTGATSSDGSHDHGGTTGSGSGGASDAANPPFITRNWIVFAGVV